MALIIVLSVIFVSIFLDSNQDMGAIALILVFGFFAIGFLWLGLVVEPKEKREKKELEQRISEQQRQNDIEYKKEYEELQSNKSPLLNSKDLLEHKVQVLSTNVPSCNKCGEDIFTFWEINNSTLTIRCNGCKKKFIIRNNDIEKGFIKDFNTIYNSFLDLLDNYNPYLEEYQNHSYDFSILRSDFPKCRGIVFESRGEVIENIISNIRSDEPSRRISDKVKDKVWNRDGGKCVQCGSNKKLEFDHIIPFSKGGSNGYRNIQLLCENCNRSKSNKLG